MNLYEHIEQTLSCRWIRGAFRTHFEIHYWPRDGCHILPYLAIISPHESDYSVFDGDKQRTHTVGIDEVVLSVPGAAMQVHQHEAGTQTYAHLHYTILGTVDPWSLFSMPRTYTGKDGDRLREALMYVAKSHTVMDESLKTIAARKESVFRLFGILVSLGTLRKNRAELLNGFSRIQPVVMYIQRNLAAPITRKDLARLANLSPSRLNVVFKGIMGMAPKQYIQDQRHKMAVSLLQDPDLTVGEIAARCGFCDQFEFSRQFKRKWGAPPLAYRKALRAPEDLLQ